MHGKAMMASALAVATFLCPSVGAAEGEAPAAEESLQLLTAREQGVFKDLYKQRIAKATSRKDKEARKAG